MPTEQIVPTALSGAEIKKAILYTLEQMLNKDCFLHDNRAYADGFSAEISAKIRVKDMGKSYEVNAQFAEARKLDETTGELVKADPREYEALNAVDARIEMEGVDPTRTRIDTDQPVPVRITDKQGHDEIRQVKYNRPFGKKS